MVSNSKRNMVFTRGNTTKTISLANPRQDVTGAEVYGVMKDIVAKEVSTYTGEESDKLDGIKKAYYGTARGLKAIQTGRKISPPSCDGIFSKT